MVGDALEAFGGDDPVQAAPNGVGMFHHVLGEHLVEFLVEGVHLPVPWNDGAGGKEKGWAAVPTGTRNSTYANPQFQKAAVFAEAEKAAIDSANPNDSTLPKSPYVGVQFAAIPEFQAIGLAVGQQMSAALAGQVTVEQALKTSQTAADREMRKGRYY